MLDIISYLIGFIKGVKKGETHVVIEGDGYTYTDPSNDGNIIITKGDE